MKLLQKIAIFFSRWLPHYEVSTASTSSTTETATFFSFENERRLRGMTREQLAKKAGVSHRTIEKIEKDYSQVGLLSVYKVAKAMGFEMTAPRFGFMNNSLN